MAVTATSLIRYWPGAVAVAGAGAGVEEKATSDGKP